MKPSRYLVLVGACLLGACDRPELFTMLTCPSPDGKLAAVYWGKEGCGATACRSAKLSVVPSGENPVIDTWIDQKDVLLALEKPGDIRLRWADATTLHVEYPDSAIIVRGNPGGIHAPRTPSVKVTYRGVPADKDGQLPGGSTCRGPGG